MEDPEARHPQGRCRSQAIPRRRRLQDRVLGRRRLRQGHGRERGEGCGPRRPLRRRAWLQEGRTLRPDLREGAGARSGAVPR